MICPLLKSESEMLYLFVGFGGNVAIQLSVQAS